MAGNATDHRADPLVRRWTGRLVVLATATAAAVGGVLGSHGMEADALPGIALGSPLLLDLERAAFVGALVAVAWIFAIRGWAGYFPYKLSTTGAEYVQRPSVSAMSAGGDGAGLDVAKLAALQVAMAREAHKGFEHVAREIAALDGKVGALARDVKALEKRLARSCGGAEGDDML